MAFGRRRSYSSSTGRRSRSATPKRLRSRSPPPARRHRSRSPVRYRRSPSPARFQRSRRSPSPYRARRRSPFERRGFRANRFYDRPRRGYGGGYGGGGGWRNDRPRFPAFRQTFEHMCDKSIKQQNDPGAGKAVDRETVCPFLLRMFCRDRKPHRPEEFRSGMIPDQQTNSSELNAYTWYDCSLSELTSLVERVRAHTTDGCELRYYRVHPDYDGSYARKYIGSVIVGEARNTDAATLAELGFHIGDYISVAVGSDTDDRARAPRDDERVKVTITNSRR